MSTIMMLFIDIIQDVAVAVDSDLEPSDHGSESDAEFTTLVHVPGREVTLSHQHFEVKLVVRKAMGLVVGRLLFENGFPGLAVRAIWNRRCLINACTSIEQTIGSHAQERYRQLSQRLKTDAEYVKTLSKLVSIMSLKVDVSNIISSLTPAFRLRVVISKSLLQHMSCRLMI
jgi:hypothetical protein